MKKYKTNDIYILDISKVTDYEFPSWHERVTKSNLLPDKYIAVKKKDRYTDRIYYQINGDGAVVLSSSYDTKERGDLFVRNKTPLNMLDCVQKLPTKVARSWMIELQEYLANKSKESKKDIEDTLPKILIERAIQTIEEYMSEPVEQLQAVGGRCMKKNFNLGKVAAYEDCLKLLRELVDGK